ncbi:uncharacterized protein CTRU02_213978 [Colletotrichum truncatum]|uniref:Uncharacterized protein n=1 Tax=Colletotrichum truncatum TaxID=5467 RepID=A0ACC3YH97_COLTU|nr:uncharacterized protein CTRU02_06291 [Colletotrichum truncatum]KAF6792795.1 hypothetical protein CTRU02_06291 [Colletotrichum truncatum]
MMQNYCHELDSMILKAVQNEEEYNRQMAGEPPTPGLTMVTLDTNWKIINDIHLRILSALEKLSTEWISRFVTQKETEELGAQPAGEVEELIADLSLQTLPNTIFGFPDLDFADSPPPQSPKKPTKDSGLE